MQHTFERNRCNRELIRKLRPSYEPKMPGRKALSTTLLDKEYEKHIRSAKEDVDRHSVILIDGWKNTASNTKTVVTMLHNINGIQLFLEAFDVSGEQETADKLSEVVEVSITKAKELYDTNFFAVVSDNAANMLKMGRGVDIWHSDCSAHVANLLAKNIVDKELARKVTIVLKEFRHTDLEKCILLKGGTKIKIPAETRWYSHRDSFACLKKNLYIMRSIVAETDTSRKKSNRK
ncbi:uncharacterized protein LOC118739819 [Rhagoletis pomonella]|uniref:uncharacterized protein LOC118739819 n=1 Tax=Rhagoletis pomonella TaxID=28610 RepID=UPI00177D65A4|nr:uncharacterized protein LOC118739819 [Rhagoletis pomonella]